VKKMSAELDLLKNGIAEMTRTWRFWNQVRWAKNI